MFCTNCGSKIEDGNVFCPNCGAAVMVEEPVQSEPVQAEAAQEGFVLSSTEEVPAKKKAPKWVAPAAIVAAIAVVVAVIVAIFGNSSARLSGPDHLQKAEGAALEGYVDSLTEVYGAFAGAMQQQTTGKSDATLTVRPGQSVMELLEEQLSAQMGGDVDLSWLSSVSMSVSADIQEELQQVNMGLLLGGKNIVSVAVINDLDEELCYLGIPELSDVFLEMDVEDVADAMASMGASAPNLAMENLPSEETVNKLLKKYINIALGAIGEVEKTKQTIELDGLKQECYVLSFELSQESMLIIAQACLQEAVEDEDLKAVIDSYSDYYNETYSAVYEEYGYEWEDVDFWDSFQDSADDMLDEMEDLIEDADNDAIVEITSYVDKKDNIIGRTIEVSDADVELSYLTVTDGGKFAFEADFGEVVIEGSGTDKKNVLNGEYVLEISGDEYATIVVSDLDQKKLDEGYISGAFRLIPSEDLMDRILGDYSSYALLADLALEIRMDTSENSSTIVLDILSDEDSLLAFELTGSTDSSGNISVPSDTVDIYDEDELMEWAESMDFDALLENLENAGVPSEYVEMIESLLTGMGGSSDVGAAVPYMAG